VENHSFTKSSPQLIGSVMFIFMFAETVPGRWDAIKAEGVMDTGDSPGISFHLRLPLVRPEACRDPR
jgi:hypothetical protein